MTTIVYSKRDIRNPFGDIIHYKDKAYEVTKLDGEIFNNEFWALQCELIGNEFPIVETEYIRDNFYTTEEYRDNAINLILFGK